MSLSVNYNIIDENIFSADKVFKLDNKSETKLFDADSFDYNYIPWVANEHFYFALGELAIIQFIPWAMARWGREWEDPADNWANVSIETWWRNISYGFEYDGDNFLTNYFAHPYHGNLYYNVGRANGFNFWESSAWSFAGSAMWEFFGETFRPAINDWINTAFNGINLGEMLYRLSAVVTDNTSTGSERVFREIGGTLLNPVRGVNRLLTGESAKLFPNPEEHSPKGFMFKLDAGARRLDKNGYVALDEFVNEGLISAEILYGNLFLGDINKPFSWFGISSTISSQEPILTNLQSFGNLFGWQIDQGEESKHLIVTTLNYNYFNNPGFNYGGTSVNAHLVSYFKTGGATSFITNADLELIAMGAVPTDYYVDVEGRNYDFGPGVGINLGASFSKGIWSLARIYYSSKFFWTQSEPSGSRHQLHLIWVDASYPLFEIMAVGAGVGGYWRNSFYPDDPSVSKRNVIMRVFIRTAFY